MANLEFKRVLNCLGFIATMAIACALATTCVLSLVDNTVKMAIFQISDIASGVVFVANILAYFITIVAGFYYCLSKRSRWFMVFQVIATVMILTAIIVGIIL